MLSGTSKCVWSIVLKWANPTNWTAIEIMPQLLRQGRLFSVARLCILILPCQLTFIFHSHGYKDVFALNCLFLFSVLKGYLANVLIDSSLRILVYMCFCNSCKVLNERSDLIKDLVKLLLSCTHTLDKKLNSRKI